MSNEPESWLWDQYRAAVDEYRFQVDLNWRRSQYYFVLNAAILVAGVGLVQSDADLPRLVEAVPFMIGAFVALLAIAANLTQKDYYLAARDTKSTLERRLGLGDLAIRTTPGMGSRRIRRLGRVTTFQVVVLIALGVADVFGATASLAREPAETTPTAKTTSVRCVVDISGPTDQLALRCKSTKPAN